MKSHVALVLISLAFLFAIFHPCHGIRCYFCISQNYDTKRCESISGDEFVHDYGVDVENCLRLFVYRNNTGEEIRQLFRFGFSDASFSDVDTMIRAHKDRGFKVDYLVCMDDLCNGD